MSEDVVVLVRNAFEEVLGLGQIDPELSFIDLGGVSLEAAQIAEQVNAAVSGHLALRADLTAADILASETVLQVSELVRARIRAGR